MLNKRINLRPNKVKTGGLFSGPDEHRMHKVVMQLFHQVLSATESDVLYAGCNIHRRETIHFMGLLSNN